jgi:hypothetical protein
LRGQEVSVDLLAQWDLVGLDERSGLRRQLEGVGRQSGHELRFTTEAGGWQAIKEFAKVGLGTAVLPLAFLNQEDLELLVARRLTSSVGIHHQLVTRDDDQRDVVDDVRQALIRCGTARIDEQRRKLDRML